jgi:hypothetical protein
VSTARVAFAAFACALLVGACSVQIGSGDPFAAPTTTIPQRTLDTTPEVTAGERPLATGCHQVAPPGASSQARAYLAAANATYPLWTAVTRTLESQGGHVFRRDLAPQIEADRQFKARLERIHFTGAAATAASRLEKILGRYIATLVQLQGTTDPLQLDTSATPLLDERRANASAGAAFRPGSPAVILRHRATLSRREL